MPQAIATRTLTVESPVRSLETRLLRETFDDEKREFDLVIATSKPVEMEGWTGHEYERFMEILSFDEGHFRGRRLAKRKVSLLDSHNRWVLSAQIGTILEARVDGEELIGRARLSRRKAVEDIWNDIKDEIITGGSAGYRVYKYQDVTPLGASLRWLKAIDWELSEMSLLSVGADEDSGPTVQKRGDEQVRTNSCVIVLGENQREEVMPNTQKTQSTPAPAATQTQQTTETPAPAQAAATPVDESQIRQEGATQERKRASEIRLAVRALGFGQEVEDEFINSGKAADVARKELLERKAKDPVNSTTIQNANQLSVGSTGVERFREDASNWLLVKAGVSDLVKRHLGADKVGAPGEMRGMSLVDLARESLTLAGMRVRGMDKMTLIGLALTHRSAGMYQSTSDFAVLLENALHKTLQAAYATQPDTWRRFCAKGTVSDFRPHPRYRLGSFGRLDKLKQNGEYERKNIPDGEKASIQADTVGNIIALTRKAIIDDDMGAFNGLSVMLGRAAMLSIEMDVYDMLAENNGMGPTMLDGLPLFDADHNNIAQVSGDPSVETIQSVRETMAKQKDPAKNEILDLRTHVFLGSMGLGADARVINDAQYDPDTANKLQKPNKVRGYFRDIVDSARLEGPAWMAFADPNVAPALEVAFLDGQEMPVLEVQNGWNVDGVEYKVRHDYGVDAIDFRPAVLNEGESEG